MNSETVLENPATQVQQLLNRAIREPRSILSMPAQEVDLLLRLLREVRLHARLAVDLKEIGEFASLPQVVQDQLGAALVVAESRSRVALWELNRIEWATRDHPALRIALMKGCAYLVKAPSVARGRIFADVDLMVAENDIPRLENLLNRRGWPTKQLSPYDDHYYRRWTHEIPPLMHNERNVEIDIHHNILPRTARLKPNGASIFENAKPVASSAYLLPTDVDLALHAMVHLMFSDEMANKLRDLLDIDGLLRCFFRLRR